jgi:hypothetical protein
MVSFAHDAAEQGSFLPDMNSLSGAVQGAAVDLSCLGLQANTDVLYRSSNEGIGDSSRHSGGVELGTSESEGLGPNSQERFCALGDARCPCVSRGKFSLDSFHDAELYRHAETHTQKRCQSAL